MVWKRPRRPFAGGAGSRRRAPGFERHGSRPAFPRAAEHGNGRHHAKGRRTDPPQGERCRPFPAPMPGSNPGHAVPLARKRPTPPEYGRCPAWGVASADGCDADEVVAVAGLQPLAAVGGRVHGALLFAPVDSVASFRRLPKEIFKESDDPARMYRFGEVYRLSPGVPPDDQLVPVIVRE